ncbi:MAG TPA: hypothetical protein VFU23_07520, partial [Gemmatimonadales bacterium]|nr:hypothetical protein [Gemmatimonadales bacterium]
MQFVTTSLWCAFALACAACGASESVVAPSAEFGEFGLQTPAETPASPLIKLVVPTYEGSGQAVHPDVLWFPAGWHGFEY